MQGETEGGCLADALEDELKEIKVQFCLVSIY
mgnify:CR=1 FL=1